MMSQNKVIISTMKTAKQTKLYLDIFVSVDPKGVGVGNLTLHLFIPYTCLAASMISSAESKCNTVVFPSWVPADTRLFNCIVNDFFLCVSIKGWRIYIRIVVTGYIYLFIHFIC